MYTPRSELDFRVARLQQSMGDAGMDGTLILHSSDLFYYCGTFQNGALYVPAEGKPLFLVRKNFSRAGEASALDYIVPMKNIKQMPQLLMEREYAVPGVLGLEMDVIPAQMYTGLQQLFPKSNLVDCSGLIRLQRAVKSAYEIGIIKYAANQMDETFAELTGIIVTGKCEYEIAAELEYAARRRGHQGLVRLRGFNQDYHYGLVLAGENGGVESYFDGPLGGTGLNPSYPLGPGRREIRNDEPVMVDYVGAFEGYCVDMSRVFVCGKLPEKLANAHQVALEIQSALMESAIPGKTGEELYHKALDMASKAGLADHFMGCVQRVSFVAHGVGIELNELPVLARGVQARLEQGMVIALEPKFIFPGEGAVGVESTHLVTEKGLQKLTCYPDQINYII